MVLLVPSPVMPAAAVTEVVVSVGGSRKGEEEEK